MNEHHAPSYFENLSNNIKGTDGTSGFINETGRGIDEYSQELGFSSREEFINYIQGKDVVDLGSGKGALSKDIANNNIDGNIISVNPRLSDRFWLEENIKSNREKFPDISEEQNKNIQKYHNSRAIAAYAQLLPLKDNSVDIILDSNAILYYIDTLDEFRDAINEMFRVLKPGGKIRMGKIYLPPNKVHWAENIMDELQIPHQRIFQKIGEGEYPVGYEIQKISE